MSKVEGFIVTNKLIFASFFVPVLLVVLAFAVTGIYPFGDSQIAVIDMYHQYVPFLSELQYKLQEGGNLFYTWNGAAGSNFWNLLSYYGASPFNLLLALFPKKFVMEGITVVLIIKIGLAGSFMALYLRYLSSKGGILTVAFATLYALCSYVMAYYWCIMWIDAVTLLPLCMLGLNRLIDDGRAVMYVVSLALIVFSNYYMAIMVCIFIMFYYPILYFLKVQNGGVKKCVATTGKAVGYSLHGVVMAAVMLLPTYISMQDTYYISSDFPKDWLIYNDALDVLNQMLPYTEVTFREGLPNLYCGIVIVVMLVFYVLSETISLREKLLNGAFLIFMFMSLNVNKLDFLWHGFHFPNQLPYRYTFVISFVLIGMAYRMILRQDEFKLKHIWAILAGGTAYYLIAQQLMEDQSYSEQTFFYGGMAWLILYCAVIILYRKGYLLKKSFALLIVVLIISEMATGAVFSFKEVGNSYRDGYFSNSKDIYKLAEKTKEEFVRTEMDYLYTLNNPAMYHYRGVSQFSSSINANTTAIMEKIGLDGSPERNRFNYNQTNPVTNAILNIKYIIAKNDDMKDPDFKQVDKSGHTRLYESKYPLAIGYMAGNEIRTWNTDSFNPFTVLDDYVRAATGNAYDGVFVDAGQPEMKVRNGNAKVTASDMISVNSDSGASAKVTLKYTAPKTQKYYIYLEGRSIKSITVTNGNDVEDIEVRNDCGAIVNIGSIKKDKSFKIIAEFDKGKRGDVTYYVKTLDYDTWDKAYDIISANTLNVTESADNYLEGTIDVKESGVLVTSIPYDKGWKLKVDGRSKEIQELIGGSFIGVPLSEGEHQISLKFRPPGLLAGIAVTIVAILILIATQLIRKRRLEIAPNLETEFDPSLISIGPSADEEAEEYLQEEADYNKI